MPAHRAVSLFSSTGVEHEWARRISTLLDISVAIDDSLLAYMCQRSKPHMVALEKAVVDLAEFKTCFS